MQRRPSDRGFNRNFDPASEGAEGGDRRRQPFEAAGDGKVRDFGNWERKGPLTPSATDMPMRDGARAAPRPNTERSFPRRDSPSWGEGQGQGAQRPAREFTERPPPVERIPTAAEMDTQWRTKMRPDAPPTPIDAPASTTPVVDSSAPSSPAPAAAAPVPASRPRLNLQKRTISEAPAANDASGAGASTDAKASPFGAARPIDTTQREREIEEKARAKREEAAKQRKDEDERRAADKASGKTANTTADASARPANNRKESAAGAATTTTAKANGAAATDETASAPQPKPYEILRRMTEQEDGASEGAVGAAEDEATAAGQDAPANGVIVDDKNVKPQEITRDISSNGKGEAEATTGEAMAEEGWSTVSKPGRKGRGGARAIAS